MIISNQTAEDLDFPYAVQVRRNHQFFRKTRLRLKSDYVYSFAIRTRNFDRNIAEVGSNIVEDTWTSEMTYTCLQDMRRVPRPPARNREIAAEIGRFYSIQCVRGRAQNILPIDEQMSSQEGRQRGTSSSRVPRPEAEEGQ